MVDRISLEKEALDVCEATDPHPRIYELPVAEGRKALDDLQNSPVHKENVDIKDIPIDTGKWGQINVRIIRPEANYEKLPVIFYIHGAGWVFGDAHTHDKLSRELAVRTNSVVIYPEYSLSPEAKYPTAIEQNYSVLNWTVDNAKDLNIDATKLTVSGDSAGGNMATVMTFMAKERKGPEIQQQLLYYPAVNAEMNTASYDEFSNHYYLTKDGMVWFYNQYLNDSDDRKEIFISPYYATKEQLEGLPAAMILNGEADVLRDEGEEYARHLREAGVDVTQVQFQGMIHDFVMINSLDQSKATRAAMDASTKWLNKRNNK